MNQTLILCAIMYLRYRDSPEVGTRVAGTIRKLISPQCMKMVLLAENVSIVEKLMGTKPKNAENAKGI